MSDIREAFEERIEIPEASIYWHQESGQYLPNTCISDDGHQLHSMTKRAAYFLTQRLEDFMAGFRLKSKPTHYAVIGSDGEMFLSYSLALYPDAEKLCELEIEQMRLEVSGADDWTVKGVTVHE